MVTTMTTTDIATDLLGKKIRVLRQDDLARTWSQAAEGVVRGVSRCCGECNAALVVWIQAIRSDLNIGIPTGALMSFRLGNYDGNTYAIVPLDDPEPTAWRPMDTAPSDGRSVIAKVRNGPDSDIRVVRIVPFWQVDRLERNRPQPRQAALLDSIAP